MDILEQDLVNLEIEATKNSIIMLKVSNGTIQNRILVHKDNIEQFKNFGYLDQRDYSHNPQIGQPLDKVEYRQQVLNQYTNWEKIKIFFKNLFRIK